MAMFLVSMESYDQGRLGNIWFKAPLWIPYRESLVQNWENWGKSGFLRGGSKFEIFEILFFLQICITNVSVVWKFNENEARLLILEQNQF